MKAIPKDHPHRKQIAALESEVATIITAALDQYRRDIFRDVTRANVYELTARAESPELNSRLRKAIYDALLKVAMTGGEVGKRQIDAEVLGVKAAPFDAGLAIDWELVNTAVADWARAMSFDLITGMTRTTANRLRAAIAQFIESPDMSMSELANQLSGLFGAVRGEMIAVTEVTRAFAAGNQTSWEKSNVVEGKQWNTVVDELVCPVCGPLNGKVVKLNETFGGFYDYPPAHPRCRCWISPVVMNLDDFDYQMRVNEIQRVDAEIMEMLKPTPESDPLFYVRPPAGRAPRGMGQEYADRRAIVNKIRTQEKYLSIAQDKIANYRGQRNRQWEISVAETRAQELKKAIQAATEIANSNAEWGYKREMVDAIIEYVGKITSMR